MFETEIIWTCIRRKELEENCSWGRCRNRVSSIRDDDNSRRNFHVNSSTVVLCLPLIGRKPKHRSEI
ncbi:hypothetical protein JTB14_008107 [Gonioctena quinquepunctata]|nr:hypothetical protein JTB14_008107 [Gonioctena quinquepunctata]